MPVKQYECRLIAKIKHKYVLKSDIKEYLVYVQKENSTILYNEISDDDNLVNFPYKKEVGSEYFASIMTVNAQQSKGI